MYTRELIKSKTILLLDCGYSIPPYLWRYNPNSSFINAVFISHTHSDHYFGLPALLTRMWEEKRKKALTIICRKGDKEVITDVAHKAHRNILDRIKFKINFIEATGDNGLSLNEFRFSFAETAHSIPNLAIKITVGKKSFCYSGDGKVTPESEKLFANTDILIHDGYFYDEQHLAHSTMIDIIEMAKKRNIGQVAFVHINRFVRRYDLINIKKIFQKEEIKILFPELNEKIKV